MTALVALVVSVAALDSLNPSTVGPALVLAVGRRALRDVAAFAAGVFAVSAAGGLVLVFGPGRQLLARVARPSPHVQHLAELVSGAVLVAAGVALWLLHRHVSQRLSRPSAGGRSAFALGAGIMAVELPTAFPYFAGLVAVVAGRHGAVADILLIVLYNAVFTAPLALVLGLVAIGGDAAEPLARRARHALDTYGPVLAPLTLVLIGLVLITLGLLS